MKPNTHGAELVSDMKIVSSNIFTKCKGDALTSEEFSDFISKNEIHEFYIGGADAVACVKSTCYNLFGGISFVVFCRNIGQAYPANCSVENAGLFHGNFNISNALHLYLIVTPT